MHFQGNTMKAIGKMMTRNRLKTFGKIIALPAAHFLSKFTGRGKHLTLVNITKM